MSRKIIVQNTGDRAYTKHRYLFSFGGVGSTHVLVYADSIDDGLEHAADALVDNELFGHITPHDSDESLGCDCTDPFECDSHTYTEAGWLTAHEWTVAEDPSNAVLVQFARQ